MKNNFFLCLGILSAALCSSFTIGGDENKQLQLSLDEMRIDVDDLKHHLHTYQVELRILEEKMRAQEQITIALKKTDPKAESKSSGQQVSQLSSLERRLAQIETRLEKMQTYANQSATAFTQYKEAISSLEQQIALQNQRLDEVSKLKGTLASISQAMQPKPTPKTDSPPVSKAEASAHPEKSVKKYKVKAGDSLEKIARSQGVSVTTIKELNDLRSDHLVVGQELKLSRE